jgi:hypothetical protein
MSATSVIPRGASHADVAAKLLRYLVSPAAQRRMAIELGYKPAYRDLYRDPELLAVQPWLTELYPVYESARPRLLSPYYLMVSQVLQPALSAVIVGRTSASEALEASQRQIDEILLDERSASSERSTAYTMRKGSRRLSSKPSPLGPSAVRRFGDVSAVSGGPRPSSDASPSGRPVVGARAG